MASALAASNASTDSATSCALPLRRISRGAETPQDVSAKTTCTRAWLDSSCLCAASRPHDTARPAPPSHFGSAEQYSVTSLPKPTAPHPLRNPTSFSMDSRYSMQSIATRA